MSYDEWLEEPYYRDTDERTEEEKERDERLREEFIQSKLDELRDEGRTECKHKFVIPSCMSGDGPYCEVCGVSLYEAPASGK